MRVISAYDAQSNNSNCNFVHLSKFKQRSEKTSEQFATFSVMEKWRQSWPRRGALLLRGISKQFLLRTLNPRTKKRPSFDSPGNILMKLIWILIEIWIFRLYRKDISINIWMTNHYVKSWVQLSVINIREPKFLKTVWLMFFHSCNILLNLITQNA